MFKDLSSNTSLIVFRFAKSISLCIGVLVLFISAQVFSVWVLALFTLLSGGDLTQLATSISSSIPLRFSLGLTSLLIIALQLVIIFRLVNKSILQTLGLSRRPVWLDFGFASASFVGYFVVSSVVLALASQLSDKVDLSQTQQLGISNPAGAELILVFALIVIIPSLIEEVLFRGILLRGLMRYNPKIIAISVSSILFGLLHLEFFSEAPLNWVAALDTALFGVVLAIVYLRRQSLWAPIMLHAIKNSLAFVVLFVFQYNG